jgi:hypothetical protein
MKNPIYIIIIIALFLLSYSCGNSGQTGINNNRDSVNKVLTVDDFLASSQKWADKEVTISGTVSLVCKHGGKKLFLFGKDADNTVKIYAGGNFSTFDVKLEGSDVEITGKVVEDTRVDEQYLNDWEADIKKNISNCSMKVCNVEGGAITSQYKNESKTSKSNVNDPYADVKAMRKKLQVSGKSYLSIYAINCNNLKELKK